MPVKTYTYLALGDSYTIGEGLPLYESFPYQLVQLLRSSGMHVNSAEIIAKTGWTTDELQAGISKTVFQDAYDFVTLLIGVNNQYRARPAAAYATEFEALLNQSIRFAGNKRDSIFILSIPDWGITPFAEGKDRAAISREIDEFNTVNKAIAGKYSIPYIDITPGTREAASDKTLLAADQLHPSAKEYARWANKLAAAIQKLVK
jgi:lysophospholipase L1-like esterase